MPDRFKALMMMTTRLASIQRFTMERLTTPESVLEHVGAVAIYTLAIASELRDRDVIVDADVVDRALLHDVDELVTGDVARPTKYATAESVALFKTLSAAAVSQVSTDLIEVGLGAFASDLRYSYNAAKRGQSGAVVALADILAVVTMIWTEVIIRGNASVIRQAHSVRRQLSAFRERIARDFVDSNAAQAFLSDIVDEADEIVNVAIARDAPIHGTKVEVY